MPSLCLRRGGVCWAGAAGAGTSDCNMPIPEQQVLIKALNALPGRDTPIDVTHFEDRATSIRMRQKQDAKEQPQPADEAKPSGSAFNYKAPATSGRSSSRCSAWGAAAPAGRR